MGIIYLYLFGRQTDRQTDRHSFNIFIITSEGFVVAFSILHDSLWNLGFSHYNFGEITMST